MSKITVSDLTQINSVLLEIESSEANLVIGGGLPRASYNFGQTTSWGTNDGSGGYLSSNSYGAIKGYNVSGGSGGSASYNDGLFYANATSGGSINPFYH